MMCVRCDRAGLLTIEAGERKGEQEWVISALAPVGCEHETYEQRCERELAENRGEEAA